MRLKLLTAVDGMIALLESAFTRQALYAGHPSLAAYLELRALRYQLVNAPELFN